MDLELLKKRKQETGYSMAQLSERSGVPVGTLQKIFSGETKQPRYQTLQALKSALGIRDELLSASGFSGLPPLNSMPGFRDETRLYEDVRTDRPVLSVSEAAPVYGKKRQGEYTLEDYYALPEDRRAELIDGVLYDMAAPELLHQRVAGEIFRQIANYISDHKGACMPFIAPVDVQLDCDEKTMVQPDVGILCDRRKCRKNGIFGAPDFLVEVLSPSTRRKDMTQKLQIYVNAGVREYWMVDLQKKVVLTYFFETEDYPVIYGFEDRIPIRIYNGSEDESAVNLSTVISWLEEQI